MRAPCKGGAHLQRTSGTRTAPGSMAWHAPWTRKTWAHGPAFTHAHGVQIAGWWPTVQLGQLRQRMPRCKRCTRGGTVWPVSPLQPILRATPSDLEVAQLAGAEAAHEGAPRCVVWQSRRRLREGIVAVAGLALACAGQRGTRRRRGPGHELAAEERQLRERRREGTQPGAAHAAAGQGRGAGKLAGDELQAAARQQGGGIGTRLACQSASC